ncbi:ribonuclease HII [Candidatus Woesearchaeota archaeon]|nr:ribonuclease HII [Candidatus Woesearchaeota archaeon]
MLICGIDEAGRGPIIGNMVMAGVLVDEEGAESLKSVGVRDSKLLSQKKRVQLFSKITAIAKKYKIISIAPEEIDAAVQSDTLNLNWLEAHVSAKIINELKPDKVIIDSPSNNVVAYKRYLMKLLDRRDIDAAVEHKADLNHVECAAASILAKVVREQEIETIKKRVGDFGSGYLTDPKTLKFLEENYEKHQELFRKSWKPYKRQAAGRGQAKLGSYGGDNYGKG